MAHGEIDWRRGIDRLYVVLWAIWSMVVLGALLMMGAAGVDTIIGLMIFLIAAFVLPALGRRALFWVIDGFAPDR